MAKIEHGEGFLVSVDTENKTLRIQKIGTVISLGETPEECELPYSLEWEDQRFFDLVGKSVEYVLSNGSVASLKLISAK